MRLEYLLSGEESSVDVLTFKSYTAIFLESIYLLELKKQNPKTRQVVFNLKGLRDQFKV